MSTRAANPVFRLSEHTHRSYFLARNDTEVELIGKKLRALLKQLPPGSILSVDFGNKLFSSGAVRTLLAPVLNSVGRQGDLAGKAIVLESLEEGGYEVRVMLESEGLAAVIRDASGASRLVGNVEKALVETYNFLAKRPTALAREVSAAFGLNTVAAATNRLVRLADMGAVLRVGQEIAEGGGLQYRYAAVK